MKKIKSTAVYSGLDDDHQWLLMQWEAQGYAFSGTKVIRKDYLLSGAQHTGVSLYLSGMKRIPLIMLSCSRTLAILGAVNYSTRENTVLQVKTREHNPELRTKSRHHIPTAATGTQPAGTQPQRPGQRCPPGRAAAGLVRSAGAQTRAVGPGPRGRVCSCPTAGRAGPPRTALLPHTQSLEGEQSTWCKMMAFFSMRKLKYFGLSNLPAASESAERQDCAGVSPAPAPPPAPRIPTALPGPIGCAQLPELRRKSRLQNRGENCSVCAGSETSCIPHTRGLREQLDTNLRLHSTHSPWLALHKVTFSGMMLALEPFL